MKRIAAGLLLIVCALTICAPQACAGRFFDRLQQQRKEYPPKFERGTMGQYYVFRNREGQVKVREVYPGYPLFPPPAMFYYGYPKSGDDTGLGF